MSETINNQYIIINKIGEGGMGSVFLAEDILLQRYVAIKSLNKPKTNTTDDIEGRFQQEALALAKLNHPNITHVYTFVQHQQAFWMVMEYVEGKTLEAWIKEHGAISTSLACSITIQILNGLHHAHQKGIIHRDLKPANIMISSEGEVKIMDFGIARIRNSQRLTQHGKSVGTLEYMSPEQIQGKEGDELTDVYATGNILYEMLSGATPFKNDTDYHLMKSKLEEKVSLHKELISKTGVGLQQIILKSLERNPSKRYTDVKTFREEIEQKAGVRILNGAALHEAIQHNYEEIPDTRKRSTSKPRSFQHSVQLLSSLPSSVATIFRNTVSGGKSPGVYLWWKGGADKSITLLIAVIIICCGLLTWNYIRQNNVVVDSEPGNTRVNYTVNLSDDTLAQAGKSGIIEQQFSQNRNTYNGNNSSQSDESQQELPPPAEDDRKTKKEHRKDAPKENNKTIPAETVNTKDKSMLAEEKGAEEVKESVISPNIPVTIPRGRNILLVLQDVLSSEDKSKDGSLVKLTCAEDIVINGQTVIPRGAIATGKIVDVEPSSKRRPGLIGFIIAKVKARDGSEIRLSSERFKLKALKDNEAAVFQPGKMFSATVHKSLEIK